MHTPISRTDSGVEEDTIIDKKSVADWQEKTIGNDYIDEDLVTDEVEQERKLVKALDMRLLPLFCVFYFTDFLDRANIGNATIGGIEEDLNLTATQMSTIISAFYITYILFEVPSNIILKRTSAVMWLSTIMLVWGVITLVMGFITSFGGLLAARLVLGAAESGYIPGMLYQMSRMYKPGELSSRIGVLICMACIAGIVSGPIAYGTSFLEGRNKLHGWQYLFILEGVPTIVLSIVSYFSLFDTVDQVSWLTPEQKALQHKRMMDQEEGDENGSSSKIGWETIYKAIADWKTWLFAVVYMTNAVNFYSFAIFSPMLIDGFGFPVLTSQLLTAPPNLLGAVVMLLSGRATDRLPNCRAKILVTGFLIMALGYMMLLILHDRWALYGSLFIIPVGFALIAPAVLGWSAVNFENLSVRAVAVAIVVMIGNTGGVMASYLYPSTDAPHYGFGNGFNIICAVLGAVVSGFTGYMLYRENRRRDKLCSEMHEPTQELKYRFYY